MKFTVLGARGFIGRNLLSFLRENGHDTWAPSPDDEIIFSRALGHVIYCIGLTADFRERPYDTMRAHIGLLTEVLERTDFDSFLYLSSTRVYSRNRTASETDPIIVDASAPSDLYNISKLAGESLCRSSGRTHVRIARLSNVIGLDPTSQNFVIDIIRQAIGGRITLRSQPLSSKDYIWIDDAVKLLAEIAVSGSETVYNVASGINLQHREIVDQLVRLTGTRTEILPEAPRHDFPVIDIQRIRNEFGFSPQNVLSKLPGLIANIKHP